MTARWRWSGTSRWRAAAGQTWVILSGARCAGQPGPRACPAETASATGRPSMAWWSAGWRSGASCPRPRTFLLSRHSTACLSSAARNQPVKVSTSPPHMMVRSRKGENLSFFVWLCRRTEFLSAHCAVPSLVSLIQRTDSTESSLTLHWSVPDHSRYTILRYQIRYCEKVRAPRQHILTFSCPKKFMFVQFSWLESSQEEKCKQE